MDLPADLTSQHARLEAGLSMVSGRLASAHQPGASAGEAFDQLGRWIDQVARMLDGYIDQQQHLLVDHARRVLGDTLEEAVELNDRNCELLERFEQFSQALNRVDDRLDDRTMAESRDRFTEFMACFERHRLAERHLYTLYSTILFPAGAATD